MSRVCWVKAGSRLRQQRNSLIPGEAQVLLECTSVTALLANFTWQWLFTPCTEIICPINLLGQIHFKDTWIQREKLSLVWAWPRACKTVSWCAGLTLWMPGAHQRFSPLLRLTRERKHTVKLLSWNKDRERSLTTYCQNRLELRKWIYYQWKSD